MSDMMYHPMSTASKLGFIPISHVGWSRSESFDSCERAGCLMLGSQPTEYSLDHALAQVDQAADRGWRATTVLPRTFDARTIRTPGGRLVQVCPANLHKHVTCNDCRLCAGTSVSGPHVGFIEHGGSKKQVKCYSQHGTPGLSHGQMIRTHEGRGKQYTLEQALAGRRHGAKAFRLCATGNAWPWIPKAKLLPVLQRIRSEGLVPLLYDHFAWRAGKPGEWLREWAMASTDGLKVKE